MKIRSIQSLFIAILVSSISLAASAKNESGVFFEPGVTFEKGESSMDWPSPASNSSGTIEGFGAVGRLGIHINEMIFAGVDGRYSQPQFKDSTNNYDAKSTSWNLAPMVGVQMPDLGFRFWGEYVLAGSLDPEASNGVDVLYREPTGPRIGAGFRLSAVSINLEYQDLAYGITELEEAGIFNGGTSEDINLSNQAFVLSLTFPLEL